MTNMNETALRNALKVYFIMGTQNCIKKPDEVLIEAIAGGITCFQFREKGQRCIKWKGKVCSSRGIPINLSSMLKSHLL